MFDVSMIPDEVAEHVLAVGKIDWGATAQQSDAEHIADFQHTLTKTREQFKTPDDTVLHGLYLEGTETVLCHAGTSPNSPTNAKILASLWNSLHALVLERLQTDGQSDQESK